MLAASDLLLCFFKQCEVAVELQAPSPQTFICETQMVMLPITSPALGGFDMLGSSVCMVPGILLLSLGGNSLLEALLWIYV